MDGFRAFIGVAGYAIEGVGVLVIIVGSIVSSALFLRSIGHEASKGGAYRKYRLNLGRSIILGLEFLIAGDIIRTVVVSETLSSVAVLALIVIIRAFLSITLNLEVEGRLPWQPPAKEEVP